MDHAERIGKLIDWITHDAEEDELLDVYEYVTGKKGIDIRSDLELYRQYIERNMERIERGGWTPVCFNEYCESEECKNDREANPDK